MEVRALNDDSVWRLELARRYIEPYRERAAIAVLGGSVAQGVADRWSDIDTIVYWDEIDRDWLETPRAAENGDRFTWVEHYPGNACLEQYRFGSVKADVAHVRLGWLDELIDGTLSGESFDTTSLDVLRGVQESIVLFGEERYEPIRARVLEYPDALRRALVEANLRVTPSWIYDGMGRDRGDLVVFYEYVLATMRQVVGMLAGLNRVYVAPEKLKRVGVVVGRMELTPPDAAARLDALLDLPREQVRAELDDLVGVHVRPRRGAPARHRHDAGSAALVAAGGALGGWRRSRRLDRATGCFDSSATGRDAGASRRTRKNVVRAPTPAGRRSAQPTDRPDHEHDGEQEAEPREPLGQQPGAQRDHSRPQHQQDCRQLGGDEEGVAEIRQRRRRRGADVVRADRSRDLRAWDEQPEHTDREAPTKATFANIAPALRGGQSLVERDREDEEREAADHEDPAAGQDRFVSS